jgi:probable rRNA maturation factor
MKAAIDITVPHRAWSALRGVKALCRRAALAALAAPAPPSTLKGGGHALPEGPVELTILLADDATLHDLNRRFRGIDKPTNVLSFPAGDDRLPGDGGPVVLGDIAIAYETCALEAGRDRKPLADHLTHLVVHGVLHLRGYDHEIEREAEVMERLETELLDGLGVADPYGPGPNDFAASAAEMVR